MILRRSFTFLDHPVLDRIASLLTPSTDITMLRRAFGALNPVFNASGAARRVARDVAGKRVPQSQPNKTRGVSTKARMLLSSILWSQNFNIKHLSRQRVGPFRASIFPAKRPFHLTRARRAAAEPTTLGARLKKLSREYGWTAVGVYMTLSVLDFPFCFLLVRTVGTEKIGNSTRCDFGCTGC